MWVIRPQKLHLPRSAILKHALCWSSTFVAYYILGTQEEIQYIKLASQMKESVQISNLLHLLMLQSFLWSDAISPNFSWYILLHALFNKIHFVSWLYSVQKGGGNLLHCQKFCFPKYKNWLSTQEVYFFIQSMEFSWRKQQRTQTNTKTRAILIYDIWSTELLLSFSLTKGIIPKCREDIAAKSTTISCCHSALTSWRFPFVYPAEWFCRTVCSNHLGREATGK